MSVIVLQSLSLSTPRFRIASEEIQSETVLLDEKESRHALVVLRLKAGDAVRLFDGKGAVRSGVVLGQESGRLRVMPDKNVFSEAAPQWRVTLAPSLIKPERMDLLFEKACELGVYAIAPFVSERSVVRLSEERREAKLRRWRKIVSESCKQCGLSTLPVVHPIRRFEDLAAESRDHDLVLIPTLAAVGRSLSQVLEGRPRLRSILVFVGPEGDFTAGEVEAAVSNGAEAVHLGPLVMRSETAALYLLSSLRFFLMEMAHKIA